MGVTFHYDKQIFNKIADVVNAAGLDAVKYAVQRGITEARENLTNDGSISDGNLRRSITGQAFMDREGVSMGIIGSALKYAPYVEYGTRPHFPPVSALYDWVRKKLGISGEKLIKSISFLIARKISKVGTYASPYLTPAIDNQSRKLGGYLKAKITEIKIIK